MRKWKKALSLTLALMLSLTLLAPAASAADVEGYQYIKFSNAPLGYVTVSYVYKGPYEDEESEGARVTSTWMVLPDNTEVTAAPPDGGGYCWSLSTSYFEGNGVLHNGGGDGESGSGNCVLTAEPYSQEYKQVDQYSLRIYKTFDEEYYEESHLLEKVNFISESTAKAISAKKGIEAVMLPAGQPMTSTTMQLADSWALPSVNSAVSCGLMPDALGSDLRVNITRAEFAALCITLYQSMGGSIEGVSEEHHFADYPEGHYVPLKEETDTEPSGGAVYGPGTSYTADITYRVGLAYNLGFVSGTSKTTFAPDALVTREQAAVMLSRVYEKLGGKIPGVTATTFADDSFVSGYAKSAVAFMADKGIVSGVGDNKFNPKGNATIQQALVIAMRMFDNLK